MTSPPVLLAEGLRVELPDETAVVQDISLRVKRGQVLGLVGESGSGKTTTALALLGFAASGVRIAHGRIVVDSIELLRLRPRELRRIRGRLIAYVPQDPSSALNPSMTIEQLVTDILRSHRPDNLSTERIRQAVRAVGLPDTHEFLRRYPHQLSGGQQQRAALAAAMVCEPAVLVLDEPTSSLDVTTQATVLGEIKKLRDRTGVAMVYVTHDLAIIEEIADRLAVMYAGVIVEEGPVREVLSWPRHPYTRGLIQAIPNPHRRSKLTGIRGTSVAPEERPSGCPFVPRCDYAVAKCKAEMPSLIAIAPQRNVRCTEHLRVLPAELQLSPTIGGDRVRSASLLQMDEIVVNYASRLGLVEAVRGISFQIQRDEVVAVIGESGSGKTTLARTVAGLVTPARGRMLFEGSLIPSSINKRNRQLLRAIQMVFQNPYESLNPRQRITAAIARSAQLLLALSKSDALKEAERLLELVRLPRRVGDRYPGELSGGERQRVAIARALVARPRLLICDEITSALDVSVQATIIELLRELEEQLGMALLIVSHNFGVVASIADRVLVLKSGVVVEEGVNEEVLQNPHHEYTKKLLAAVPGVGTPHVDASSETIQAIRRSGRSSHPGPRPEGERHGSRPTPGEA